MSDMTWQDLSDDELTARLKQRIYDGTCWHCLVQARDEPEAAEEITRILS